MRRFQNALVSALKVISRSQEERSTERSRQALVLSRRLFLQLSTGAALRVNATDLRASQDQLDALYDTAHIGLGDDLIETVTLPFATRTHAGFGGFIRNALCLFRVYCGAKVPDLDLTGVGLHIVDPEQLLALDFRFVNLALKWHDFGRILRRTSTTVPGYIIVELPSQGISEESFFRDSQGFPNAKPRQPARAVAAGESRIVFRVDEEYTKYDLGHLLSWGKYPLSVSMLATPEDQQPPEVEPADYQKASQVGIDTVTAIEYPYKLFVSPTPNARFAVYQQIVEDREHSEVKPPSCDQTLKRRRVALWHARLGTELGKPSFLRALWTPGYPNALPTTDPAKPACKPADPKPVDGTATDNDDFLMPLANSDRQQLVLLTTDSKRAHARNVKQTAPIEVQQFFVSSLGASLQATGDWPRGDRLDLQSIVYRSRIARDNWVEVHHYGYLCPSGFPVTLVVITSRETADDTLCAPAYTIQRAYIVGVPQSLPFNQASAPQDGRIPFLQLDLKPPNTAPLDWPGDSGVVQSGDPKTEYPCAFWPRVGKVDVRFDISGKDMAGEVHSLPMPQIFVSNLIVDDKASMQLVYDAYAASAQRIVPAADQRIAFAPVFRKGDTDLQAVNLHFLAEPLSKATDERGSFYPVLSGRDKIAAEIRISAGNAFSGLNDSTSVSWNDAYLKYGLPASHPTSAADFQGETFLETVTPPDLPFPKENAGAMLAPKISIEGISRQLGPVSDIQNTQRGTFQPSTFFAKFDVRLLGGVSLKDIVSAIVALVAPDAIPKIVSETFATLRDVSQLGNQVWAEIKGWVNQLQQPVQDEVSAIRAKAIEAQTLLQNAVAQTASHGLLQVRRDINNRIAEARRQLANIAARAGTSQSQLDGLLNRFEPNIDTNVSQLQTTVATQLADLTLPQGQLTKLQDQLNETLNSSITVENVRAVVRDIDLIYGELDRLSQTTAEGVQYVNDMVDRIREAQNQFNSCKQAVTDAINQARADANAYIDQQYTNAKAQLDVVVKSATDEANAFWNTSFGQYVAPIEQDLNSLNSVITSLKGINPSTVTQFLNDLQKQKDALLKELLAHLSTEVVYTYDWHPEMHDGPSRDPIFIASYNGNNSTLDLHSEIHEHLDLTSVTLPQPTYEIQASLQNFKVELLPGAHFITIPFEELSVSSGSGQGTKVRVSIPSGEVLFHGVLEFIRDLKDRIGLSKNPGLAVDISPTGVQIGFQLAVDKIPCGVFNMYGLAFTATVVLPFIDQPAAFRFAFCSRQRPCFLAVGPFGGGAFAAIELGLDGVHMFEAALEFGAHVELDVALASGQAYVVAGIYFSQTPSKIILSGYLRAGGALNVIHIVTVSVTFYMGFTYQVYNGASMVFGEATVCVEIDILFFSTTVELHCRREFAGSSTADSASRSVRAGSAARPEQHFMANRHRLAI